MTASETPTDPGEAPWHRLDPRMIIVRPLHDLVGLLPLVIAYLVFGNGDTVKLIIGCAAVGLLLVHGLAHWLLTRYRVGSEQVQLRTGLIARKHLAVRTERIRTVETTAKFGHRMFGLAAVRIGTGQQATDNDDDLELDAITKAEAERLRAALLQRRTTGGRQASRPARQGSTIATIQWAWLRYAPLTLTGLAAVGVVVGLGMRAVNELDVSPSAIGPVNWAIDAATRHSLVVVVLVVLAVLVVLIVLASLLGYLVQFANYLVTAEPDHTVRIRRGLFTARSISIEEAKLRGVRVREPVLLRLARGARTDVLATGMSKRDLTPLLVPPAPLRTANRISAAVLGTTAPPTATSLRAHPPAALRRRLVRTLAPVAVLEGGLAAAAAAGALPQWPWQLGLVLVPLAAWLGIDRYRALGHALHGRYLVARSASLPRETVALQRTGIIGWNIRRSFFQRRSGLVTLTATTAAGDGAYQVLDLEEAEAIEFAEAATPGLLRPFLAPSAQSPEGLGLGSAR